MKYIKDSKYFIFGLIITAFIFLGIGYFSSFDNRKPDTIKEENAEELQFIPSRNDSSKEELVFIYIGSSTCKYCNLPGLPKLLDRIKVRLQHRAESLGIAFNTIGISKDHDLKNGIQHLNNKGKFNEVSVGNEWSGIGMDRYIWSHHSGPAGTPQIIVAKRTYTRRRITNGSHMLLRIEDETILVRKLGPSSIKGWLNLGLKLPRF